MAESQVVAKQALRKLEDQLTCAICLDAFKYPKLLQCFHVYCKDCIQQLVVKDQQGEFFLVCPTCRQSTFIPSATGVSGLQSAFHIHHLLEIQEALEKVSEPRSIVCEKCVKTARTVTNFCRDCGKFICDICSTAHSEWEEFSTHEVVSVEQVQSNVKQLVPPKKVTLYCPHHKDMKLDLYCETCEELICLHCTVKKHKDHQNDLVGDTYKKHKSEITTALEPVDSQLGMVNHALEQLDTQSKEVCKDQITNKEAVEEEIRQLHEVLDARKAELIGQIEKHTQMKLKNLSAQKDELETVQTQLDSCLSFVRDSLKTGSQEEMMRMKKAVMKQVKEMTEKFNSDMLPPCEPANVRFTSSPLTQASQLQQFGKVFLQQTSPEKCYATGNGLEIAEPCERATVVLHVVDNKGKAFSTLMETVTSELVSEITGEKIDCSVKKTVGSQYEISYQPTNRGRYQLHIKVEGDHIKGSPFPVTVMRKLAIPIKTISQVSGPWGVAIKQSGEIVVAERDGYCISVLNPDGRKLRSFGSQGLEPGQFKKLSGVAVDDDGNILATDSSKNCIQKFAPNGQFITDVGERGKKSLKFTCPIGITIHPDDKHIHVADNNNHRIQVLNSDLTFSHNVGGRPRGTGGNQQFYYPWDVAFDGAGKMYVADCSNHCIQVFSEEGKFLKRFGQKGSRNGDLNNPNFLCIDAYDVVYVTESGNDRVSVFTCEGAFLTSFGTKGSAPGQFKGPRGIAVDRNGMVYVSDTDNNRLQLF